MYSNGEQRLANVSPERLTIDPQLKRARCRAVPTFSVHPDELQESTKKKLTDRGYFYANSNAGIGWTDRANREAFYRWRIIPRTLVDTNVRDLTSACCICALQWLANTIEQRPFSAIRYLHQSCLHQLASTNSTIL